MRRPPLNSPPVNGYRHPEQDCIEQLRTSAPCPAVYSGQHLQWQNLLAVHQRDIRTRRLIHWLLRRLHEGPPIRPRPSGIECMQVGDNLVLGVPSYTGACSRRFCLVHTCTFCQLLLKLNVSSMAEKRSLDSCTMK